MRRLFLVAGIAAATLIPSFAMAQQQTCEQQRSSRLAGTVAGAGIGAIVGSAVAGRDDRAAGAVIGGVAGAILGAQAAKSQGDCAHAYGYYDSKGLWHANDVAQAQAAGYYDRDGVWMQGAPNGYYDANGRWVAASSGGGANGYYDANSRWVPASSTGYYDARGQWVAGAASGYYDTRGQWVAGPATGRYDRNGRWMAGQASGRPNADGVWVPDAQPGYYDSNGRWHAGEAWGYYDTRGRWVATAAQPAPEMIYNAEGAWDGAPADLRGREVWLDQRIRSGMRQRTLGVSEGNEALRQLSMIRRQEMRMPHPRGRLNRGDTIRIQARLDRLADSLHWKRPAKGPRGD